MKNPLAALLFLTVISFLFSCEPENSGKVDPVEEDIIEIPDEYFKAALVNSNSIDTNGILVTGMMVGQTTLTLSISA